MTSIVASLLLGVACKAFTPPCTCVPAPPLASSAAAAAELRGYSAVFEGTVVRTGLATDSVVEATDTTRGRRVFRWEDLVVTLAVARRWKGDVGDTVIVRTPAETTMCGAEFVNGRTYLVFAHPKDDSGIDVVPPARRGDAVYATKCSRTTEMRRETRTLVELLGRPAPVLRRTP